MAEVVTIYIEGLRELGERLRKLNEEVIAGRVIRQAASAAAAGVRNEARKKVAKHKKTGLLEKSIQVRRVRAESKPGHEVYAVGVFKVHGGSYANNKKNRRLGRVGKKYEVEGLAYYWRFLEFGTVKMAPDPFLVPAFNAKKTDSIETMKKKTDEGIKKALVKMGRA